MERSIAQKIREEILLDYAQKNRKGIYAETSKLMAYNSNRIEGSTLTSEETASLFDTGELLASGNVVYRARDIEEMNGHFYMFNHALETLHQPLSTDLIKSFHFCLKNGVFEDRANGYAAGEFKQKANIVSDIETASPQEVPERIAQLVDIYNRILHPELKDLMQFHADYEHIHPFQDGNGRTGRMILFRECLRNDLVPVIIRDETKAVYYHALHEAQVNGDVVPLVKYAGQMQELYLKRVRKYFET